MARSAWFSTRRCHPGNGLRGPRVTRSHRAQRRGGVTDVKAVCQCSRLRCGWSGAGGGNEEVGDCHVTELLGVPVTDLFPVEGIESPAMVGGATRGRTQAASARCKGRRAWFPVVECGRRGGYCAPASQVQLTWDPVPSSGDRIRPHVLGRAALCDGRGRHAVRPACCEAVEADCRAYSLAALMAMMARCRRRAASALRPSINESGAGCNQPGE